MFHSFLDNGGVSIHHIVENPFLSVELFVNIIKHIEKIPWSIVKVCNKLIVIQVFKITVVSHLIRLKQNTRMSSKIASSLALYSALTETHILSKIDLKSRFLFGTYRNAYVKQDCLRSALQSARIENAHVECA